jgi:hypothetical protein
LSVSEIVEIYRKVTGRAEKPFPIPRFLPRLTLPSDMSRMLYWFAEDGYHANINALRQEHPKLLSFASWLKERAEETAIGSR